VSRRGEPKRATPLVTSSSPVYHSPIHCLAPHSPWSYTVCGLSATYYLGSYATCLTSMALLKQDGYTCAQYLHVVQNIPRHLGGFLAHFHSGDIGSCFCARDYFIVKSRAMPQPCAMSEYVHPSPLAHFKNVLNVLNQVKVQTRLA
jgi:hypothetical protein